MISEITIKYQFNPEWKSPNDKPIADFKVWMVEGGLKEESWQLTGSLDDFIMEIPSILKKIISTIPTEKRDNPKQLCQTKP